MKTQPACSSSPAHTQQRPRCQGPTRTCPSPHPLPLVASRSSIRGRPQVQGVTPSWLEPRGLLTSDRAAPSKAPGSHLLAPPRQAAPPGHHPYPLLTPHLSSRPRAGIPLTQGTQVVRGGVHSMQPGLRAAPQLAWRWASVSQARGGPHTLPEHRSPPQLRRIRPQKSTMPKSRKPAQSLGSGLRTWAKQRSLLDHPRRL